VKKIVVRFFNLTYMGHWWVMVITAIIGFPLVVDPGRVLLEDIMILDIFFTWIFGPIVLINFSLMIFKFLKDVLTDD
jgi:phosphate/sulfate permease|tara:strand:+ start:207 stop:437 length:231 start_codon:yes stop_codon:yes gene_type:complete